MIDRLLETARRKVDGADALWRREEQTTVAFESGRLKAGGISEEAGVNLRVLAGGRLGVAGGAPGPTEPTEERQGGRRAPPPWWGVGFVALTSTSPLHRPTSHL